MNALIKERLFEPFVDPVDGVVCVSAQGNGADVAAQAGPLGWRFPLWLDPDLPLCQQVEASSHTPASSRFGPYCDNITGMNWQRPDGRTVRVGERVVKSTTGYDLLRFLLESGTHFGRPLDFVLRLRPACEVSRTWQMHGESLSLSHAASAVLQSPWIHWLESLDAMVDGGTSLRAAVHCPSAEVEIFEDYLSGVAGDFGLEIKPSSATSLPTDGLPDFVIKTTVDRVFPTAIGLGGNPGVRCVALCSNGVVLGYVSDPGAIRDLLQPLEAGLYAEGGHWQSRHAADRFATPPESEWIATLSEEWRVAR